MPNHTQTNHKSDIDMPPFHILKFGVMVNSVDMSQKCFYLVKHLNDLVDADYMFSPIVFYKEYAQGIDVNRFCTLLEQQVWGYSGVVIATSIETAETLIQCPCPTKKFFYVWNMEWLYDQYSYSKLAHVYLNDELELIARNNEHASVIEKCWKKPKYIMDNFDTNILKQVVGPQQKEL
jgi:hypothetical protein